MEAVSDAEMGQLVRRIKHFLFLERTDDLAGYREEYRACLLALREAWRETIGLYTSNRLSFSYQFDQSLLVDEDSLKEIEANIEQVVDCIRLGEWAEACWLTHVLMSASDSRTLAGPWQAVNTWVSSAGDGKAGKVHRRLYLSLRMLQYSPLSFNSFRHEPVMVTS